MSASKSTECIVRAAIQYYKKGDDKPRTIFGFSHAECIQAFNCVNLYQTDRQMDKELQGFLTNEGRFVDRKEALEIAKTNHQLKYDNYPYDELYSEFVNYKCSPEED